MRTTVTLSDDVASAIDRVRRERSLGLSEAVNDLIRAGLAAEPRRKPFRQRTRRLGLRIDVTDVADALETLDGPSGR
jgi:metal-responsive CopG/Arc/MetJ family transcriptional regulator